MKIIGKTPTGFLRNRWIIHTEKQGNLILHKRDFYSEVLFCFIWVLKSLKHSFNKLNYNEICRLL